MENPLTNLDNDDKIKIIFDAGPIISLSMNGILYVLKELKNQNPRLEFLIPYGVKQELIDKPLTTKRFKFEALKILKLIEEGIFTILPKDSERKIQLMNKIDNIINKAIVKRKDPDSYITLLHKGELELYAEIVIHDIDYAIIDEHLARKIIENPKSIKRRIEKKTHDKIIVKNKDIFNFKDNVLKKDVKIFRSSELVTICFEKGLFSKYEVDCYKDITNIVSIKAEILEAILLALKNSGCTVLPEEIYKIMSIEKKNNLF